MDSPTTPTAISIKGENKVALRTHIDVPSLVSVFEDSTKESNTRIYLACSVAVLGAATTFFVPMGLLPTGAYFVTLLMQATPLFAVFYGQKRMARKALREAGLNDESISRYMSALKEAGGRRNARLQQLPRKERKASMMRIWAEETDRIITERERKVLKA